MPFILPHHSTVASGESIKNFVESFRVDTVRKFLGRLYIGNFKERIILHPVCNLFFIQFMCQQVMAVHVKLKPEEQQVIKVREIGKIGMEKADLL